MDANGDAVIAWTSSGQDGSGYGIYADIFRGGGGNPFIALGLENAGTGFVEVLDPTIGYGHAGWPRVDWDGYNTAVGQTRPAWCDLDGDGTHELVIGLGPGGAGWLQVLDDRDAGFAHLGWIQVHWDTYNAADGETRPACGDLDNDNRDEIVVGLGSVAGKGWVQILDDANTGLAHLKWIQASWAAYNTANGELFPAVGNFDGDAAEEIALGLGSGGAGWVQIRNDAGAGFGHVKWHQGGWRTYNAASGETHPAVCDLDGDGSAELVLGLGTTSGGWMRVLDSAAAYAPKAGTPISGGWVTTHWNAYNAAVGVTFPACGNVDGDPADELAVGLGSFAPNGGYVEILDDLSGGMVSIGWPRVHWSAYNSADGETRPALSR
jgi:hypothetical protein